MNRRTVSVILGVILLLALFVVAIYYFGFSTTKNVEPKSKVGTVKKVAPSVRERLDNHEKRLQAREKKDREHDFRLNKHAEAISDLEKQLNEFKDSSVTKDSGKIAEKRKKEKKPQKYYPGWDYKDFPENW